MQVLSVTALTARIKGLLEGSFGSVTVEGEISNYRPSAAGHVYFTLKDEGAAIGAVMFRGRARSAAFAPADGMLVRVTGSLSVYAQRGNYQIIVESMESAGAGALLAMLEERKRRLQAEGLFDAERKQPLPAFPRTVGVVTSSTGAALRDIVQITRRRNRCVSLLVLPCLVQGAEAAAQIAAQIRAANVWRLCDVLIVGRGGGSLEDLLPFSDEGVVRAAAASRIPLVSAVGHEVDWALLDYAADTRAPTPSGAAELVTPERDALLGRVFNARSALTETVKRRLEKMRLCVRLFTPQSMELAFRRIEQPYLAAFDDAKVALLRAMQGRADALRRRVERAAQTLEGANPKAILSRGYAFVRAADTGKIIRSAAETAPGALLEITPASGAIRARVESVSP